MLRISYYPLRKAVSRLDTSLLLLEEKKYGLHSSRAMTKWRAHSSELNWSLLRMYRIHSYDQWQQHKYTGNMWENKEKKNLKNKIREHEHRNGNRGKKVETKFIILRDTRKYEVSSLHFFSALMLKVHWPRIFISFRHLAVIVFNFNFKKVQFYNFK